jgi:hypothetical protein
MVHAGRFMTRAARGTELATTSLAISRLGETIMANRKDARRKHDPADLPTPPSDLGGPPTTGGSMPGGEPTGLRHQTDMLGLGGGMGGAHTGGMLPTGAGGGTGTGAGGLATGIGGIGGTRNLVHGAGRPAYGPAPLGESAGGPLTADTAQPGSAPQGAQGGEASQRTGAASAEPGKSPSGTVRGAGSGRR